LLWIACSEKRVTVHGLRLYAWALFLLHVLPANRHEKGSQRADLRTADLISCYTCATLLLSRGVHAKLVQELLAHATIAVTLDTYSHVLPGMGDGLADAMEEASGCRVAVCFAVNEVPTWLETCLSASIFSTFYLQNKEKAERVGFEPTGRLQTFHAISSRAPSANSDTSPNNGESTRHISGLG
jgi:hypothetical protein